MKMIRLNLVRGILALSILFLITFHTSATGPTSKDLAWDPYIVDASDLYTELHEMNPGMPSLEVFSFAFEGFRNLKIHNSELKRDILTVYVGSLSPPSMPSILQTGTFSVFPKRPITSQYMPSSLR
jgi:hypothetical protein